MKDLNISISNSDLQSPSNESIKHILTGRIPDLNLHEIEAARNNIDITSLKDSATSGWKAGIIEQGDEVNGVEFYEHPNYIQREKYQSIIDDTENALVMMYGNGRYVQDIDPETASPIPESEAEQFANDFIKETAQSKFESSLIDSIYNFITGEDVGRGYYELSTDATDSIEPFNGIPDINADGTSSATITIQKHSSEGNALTGTSHDEKVYLTTNHGALSSHSVTLSEGTATFDLTASEETVIANVEVMHPDHAVKSGNIRIQFS